jgi:hypothetical protein
MMQPATVGGVYRSFGTNSSASLRANSSRSVNPGGFAPGTYRSFDVTEATSPYSINLNQHQMEFFRLRE